jgi:hypothetical protein
MPTVIRGPAWSENGLALADSRYPLRVEQHLGRLVTSLLPGVITVTPQARSFALHSLVWAEVEARGLDTEEARQLLRRSEVVFAGISLQHRHAHPAEFPQPHGGDVVESSLVRKQYLDVAELAGENQYSQNRLGFGGVYLASERLLGMVGAGSTPTTGARADVDALGEALIDVLRLAASDRIESNELAALPHLCICGAPRAADGPWLRKLFVKPPEEGEFEKPDRSRRQTAVLLGRVVLDGAEGPLQDVFRRKIGFGDFIESDPVACDLAIAQAWRGAVLRFYSVGAWRRLWSWLVELLASDAFTIAEMGERLGAALPDITLSDLLDSLPATTASGILLPAEERLRSAFIEPDPLTELQILAVGSRRLDDLAGRAQRAFIGDERNDDLGPAWVQAQFDAHRSESLQEFAFWLAEYLVRRALRIALTKMGPTGDDPGRMWIPSRIRENAGLISRQSAEGWNDVGLRISTFTSVLLGCGVLEAAGGRWALTAEREALLV